jgi:hypothetical protein
LIPALKKEMDSISGPPGQLTRISYYDFEKPGSKPIRVTVKENKAAWAEAIDALERQGTLPPLQWLPELSMSTGAHVADHGP